MKKISGLMFFLLLVNSFANAQTISKGQCGFCGEWRWEENDQTTNFSVFLYKKDSLLLGQHCFIINSGSRMDCAVEKDEISLRSRFIESSSSFLVDVTSFYSGKKGKAKITIQGKKLIWELIEKPKGECYFPKHAVLIR